MENWRKNSRKDIVMVDVDALVPKEHLLRKIEDVMSIPREIAHLDRSN